MNKKGISRKVLVELLLVLAGAAIIILVLGEFSPLYGRTADEETCRLSVILRSNEIIQQTEKIGRKYPLKCKTPHLCYAAGGKCPEEMIKEKVADENEIKKKIATELYSCWNMMGEGKLQFLGEKRCVICSIIHFNDETRKKFPNINGLNDYLVDTKVPGKEFTYLEYVMGAGKEDVKKKIEITGEDRISTYNDYAIAYVSAKEDTMKHVLDLVKGIPVAVVGGVAVGTVMFFFPAASPLLLKAIVVTGALTPWAAGKIGEWAELKECVGGGCASLFFFPYGAEHAKEIAEICPNAESIP